MKHWNQMWNPIWLKFELRIRSLLFSILFRIVKPGTRKQVLILIWLMWNDVWRQIYKIASCKLRAEIKISETQNNLQENIKTSKQQRGLSRSKRKLAVINLWHFTLLRYLHELHILFHKFPPIFTLRDILKLTISNREIEHKGNNSIRCIYKYRPYIWIHAVNYL